MNKRSKARLGVIATGALLMGLGSALVVPAAAGASPSATTSAPGSAGAVHPTMWIDCDAMSWVERLWSSYC